MMEQHHLREALNVDIFLESLLQSTESNDSDDDVEDDCALLVEDRQLTEERMLLNADVDKSRQWLKDILLEESSDSDEESIEDLIKHHQMMQTYANQYAANPSLSKYMYYSSDLLTGENRWPSHYQSAKKKYLREKVQARKSGKTKKQTAPYTRDILTHGNSMQWSASENLPRIQGKIHGTNDTVSQGNIVKKRAFSRSRKKNTSAAAIRRHVWKIIVKKEIPKAYRHNAQNQSNKVTQLKKVSKDASKRVRARALESRLRTKKEIVIARARRMTREAQLFWKKYVRVEKKQRKHAEKQALEQQRIDDELREAYKQQQKLKFLITQTELYAHFVTGKLTNEVAGGSAQASNTCDHLKDNILVQLDEGASYTEDDEHNKEKALDHANEAFLLHQSKMKMYASAEELFMDEKSIDQSLKHAQPKLLQGQLTGYQLVGLNWIFNLYLHGLNGILADDMGLGKTVQTIAFFAGLAESYNTWGPFLVIAPASTLNNWHQEFSRFLPTFKILPYWGTTSERKVLRLFWNQKSDVKPDSCSPFHVLITSYQLATTDMRYFQRIPWHYIVFDEAQALKSSSSIRWRTLLDFKCRNRLLLTGTPIQNTMAELWALLHFIMPTLFDNHAEFNEWFTKNIENHVENKSSIDESDLSRLHRILKPFILRRLKCNVEHELTEKVEVRVLCQLSPRQRVLYDALQKNILVKELLKARTSSGASTNNIVLMNLVMQFRKVCNHPDIFHSREISSPLTFKPEPYIFPRLFFESFFSSISKKKNSERFFYSDFNIHSPVNVRRSLLEAENSYESSFSFLRLINLSIGQYWKVFSGDINQRCCEILKSINERRLHVHNQLFSRPRLSHFHIRTRSNIIRITEKQHKSELHCKPSILLSTFLDFHDYSSPTLSLFTDLLFVRHFPEVLGHCNLTISCVADNGKIISSNTQPIVPEEDRGGETSSVGKKNTQAALNRHRVILSVKPDQLSAVPPQLKHICFPKVSCNQREVYCNDLSALRRFKQDADARKNIRSFTANLGVLNPVIVPDRERLISDSGKLQALDMLLSRLKDGGHRVLVYSQMTKMIDILEEYMIMRRHVYVRLDGSCRISSRRDSVAGFQSCDNIFVFLLSTRAGGLGINLTAADTVIFYDSDWNPAVDQQAMDRAHRLGQTKQVTVYRLVCKGTVDERMLARAEAKSAIQRMVIQDGCFKMDSLNQNEMVSLLLDDDHIQTEAQKDDVLRTSFEKIKVTRKRKNKRGVTADVKSKKRVKKTITGSHSYSTDLEALKGSPKVINITPDDNDSFQVIDTKSSEADSLIVVDDNNIVDVTSADQPVDAQRRRRGRPRMRPVIPNAGRKTRRLHATTVQRWTSMNRRGRGRGGARRGRSFSGKAAAMAGARAGAIAASVAAALRSCESSNNA